MNVSVVLPELREKAAENYTGWKRSLESLEDSRTGTNASVKIELAEGDAELLQQQGLTKAMGGRLNRRHEPDQQIIIGSALHP
ncbi:hypothetical protein [Bradyrhizobium sp. USDA 241]|uniref:hypothetical protein n=1 Tax=Bradyrhizobium sp. USDA 241 TaxID=3377725 RepID=UPI003C746B8D